MNLKDKKLWLELYEIAQNIEKLEPWKYFPNTNLFQYLSSPLNDVFFCNVVGHDGIYKGIGIYQGKQVFSLYDFTENEMPDWMFANYQNCLMCSFTDRKGTLPKNRQIIKELGLNFRGTWITFENFEKGYEPSAINITQVKILIEALKNFYMMFRVVIEKRTNVEFGKNEVLIRYYDDEMKLFINQVVPLMLPKRHFDTIKLQSSFGSNIIKTPQTDVELEYEFLNFLPIKVDKDKDKDGRYYLARARVLADRKSGIILQCDIIDKKNYDDKRYYIIESLDLLINSFCKNGRPKKIYVRDEESKMFLDDMASQAGIKLVIKPKLKTIDDFYNCLIKKDR